MRVWVTICLAGLLAGCGGIAPTPAALTDYGHNPAFDARIEVAQFDRALMAQAIFHETNRVRSRFKLPAFRHRPKLDDAADLEAAVGRVYQPPSHHNPFPMIGTPLARVQFVGLNPGRVAENIALLPIQDTRGAVMIVRGGKSRYVRPGSDIPVPAMTYREFAAAVLELWMNSPGHRANLMNPDLIYLGCSASPNVNIAGIDQMFCVQVFFTPRS